MTAKRVFGTRDHSYSTCDCCARHIEVGTAIQYVAKDPKNLPVFLCLDCPPKGMEMLAMASEDLDKIERAAIEHAAHKVMDAQAAVILQALWECGVRNLADLTPQTLDDAMERLTLDGGLLEPAREFLLEYGAECRRRIKIEELPF
jgi:hypothetical protein